jgi:hypothetical protein
MLQPLINLLKTAINQVVAELPTHLAHKAAETISDRINEHRAEAKETTTPLEFVSVPLQQVSAPPATAPKPAAPLKPAATRKPAAPRKPAVKRKAAARKPAPTRKPAVTRKPTAARKAAARHAKKRTAR